MGSFSIWHWLIVLLVIALLFGAGRISSVMGDVGKGIKSFKKGLNEDDGTEPKPQPRLADEHAAEPRPTTTTASPDIDKR
jgi:sec-independent protein translocase protein TatA